MFDCCQAEGPAAVEEEESGKSESEVHDENEDEDEDGSEEVSTNTFYFVEFHLVGKSLHCSC